MRRSEPVHPRRRRLFRPAVEPCEGRWLLSVASLRRAPHAIHRAPPLTDRLASYRVFVGQVRQGRDAGLTIAGRLVLGVTDGHGQVVGFLFATDGSRDTVVGLVVADQATLLLSLPDGGQVQLTGRGTLQRVRRGLPGGQGLIGAGLLRGPGRNDVGAWATLP